MRLYISTGSEVAVWSGALAARASLPGSGALCVSGRCLFCASCEERVIWRMDSDTLMPQAMIPAGPGVCDLCISQDGKRLYALLGEADSVLMCDAGTGAALVVCRCGVNPRRMALSGDVLAVAGGESCCVHLLNAYTLEELGVISMPAPVSDIAFVEEGLAALCRTPSLTAQFVISSRSTVRISLPLGGMPGALLAADGSCLCAVQGFIYSVSAEGGIQGIRRAPGCASRMAAHGGKLYLCDALSERLYVCMEHGGWRTLSAHAVDFTVDCMD